MRLYASGSINHLLLVRFAWLMLLCLFITFAGQAWGETSSTLPERIYAPNFSIKMPNGKQMHPSTESLVASICYVFDNMDIAPFEDLPYVILAVYENGTIVWSDNLTTGGPPYHAAMLSRDAVTSLSKDLSANGYFQKPHLNAWHGFDHSDLSIYLKDQGSYVWMRSMHEIIERRNNVMLSRGARKLQTGETREEYLAKEPWDYLDFRESWSQIKQRLLKMIPADGSGSVSTVTVNPSFFYVYPRKEEK